MNSMFFCSEFQSVSRIVKIVNSAAEFDVYIRTQRDESPTYNKSIVRKILDRPKNFFTIHFLSTIY